MSDLKTNLAALRPRDLEFLETYSKFLLENPEATDRDIAKILGVTRETIINRRRRIRARGVPLPSLQSRGFQRKATSAPACKCPTCGRSMRKRRERVEQ